MIRCLPDGACSIHAKRPGVIGTKAGALARKGIASDAIRFFGVEDLEPLRSGVDDAAW